MIWLVALRATSRPTCSLATRTHIELNTSLNRYPLLRSNFKIRRPYTTSNNENDRKSPKEVQHDNKENYPPFYRRLALLLPHIPRPTRDDLLKVADGFWARARIRWKWFAIRSWRSFGVDDFSALFTWFLMSQTVWILVGTTTFFSMIFATANSLRLQEYLARGISDYLTSETGFQIAFESAIVPKWKSSRISFKNVSISRNLEHTFQNEGAISLTVDSIDVTLNLMRWLDGKGLIQDAIVQGVRGVIDRTNVPPITLPPSAYRHTVVPGSFHLDTFALSDVLITMLQSNHRPYSISVFSAQFNTLRRQWLVYDLLRECEGCVGMFDGSMLTLHRPQMVDTKIPVEKNAGKMSRLRVDGVNVSHLKSFSVDPSSATTSPISWIKSGKLDAVLDFHFPAPSLEEDVDLNLILSEMGKNISNAIDHAGGIGIKSDLSGRVLGQKELARPPLSVPDSESESAKGASNVRVDIDLRFRDIKAAVPLFRHDMSVTNSALIRPIVAFMNANRTLIPIHCRVSKVLDDFDGSWTLWETGLMDDISMKVYDALAHHVAQSHLNNKRLKTVSLWSLRVTTNSIIGMLENIVDHGSKHLRDIYVNQGTLSMLQSGI